MSKNKAYARTRSSPFTLTPRELEVETLLKAGLTRAQVAAKLGVRPNTVRDMGYRALDKRRAQEASDGDEQA